MLDLLSLTNVFATRILEEGNRQLMYTASVYGAFIAV